MRQIIFLIVFLLGVEIHAQASTFYISPIGDNTNSGLSPSAPWKTFSFALPRLQPGDTLVLLSGTYKGSGSGYPNINCANGARNGTVSNPITIRANNERQAFIQGDGSATPLSISKCSYWIVEGIRAENGDFPNSNQTKGTVFIVTNSNNIIMKRLIGARDNRYFNSHIFYISFSSSVLVEENEAYYFHRHGFSAFKSSFVTMRRNYANSRNYPDIPGGYSSHLADRGDEGLVFYSGTVDSIMENNISEGNHYLKNIGSRNLFLGNISIGDKLGISLSSKSSPVVDNLAVDNVSLNALGTGFYSESPGVMIENATCIGSGGNSFIANNKDNFSPEYVVRNSLALNNNKSGFQVQDSSEFAVLVLEYLNSFNNGINYNTGTQGRTNSMSVNPELGNCIVYIPDGSPMKGTGKNGKDIGANIIFRYEDGDLTNQKLWDQNTGQFPCGALVSGLNDTAGNSCINVHQRLNVGFNGCSIP